MKKQHGFTLIELVVVIVVLGILAVTVLPRFLSYQDDAHDSVIEGTAAQFQQAIDFVHAQWAVEGGGDESFVNLPGYGLDENGDPQLDINDVGYPIGIDKGNAQGEMTAPRNIGRGHQGCISIWEAIMITDFTFSTNAGDYEDVDFITRRARDIDGNQSICYYAYTLSGFNTSDADESGYVIWYDSVDGTVTTQIPERAQ
ncbi:prepilin-type N-terminal cleavage/methylation domain-containing protein [Vibrio paucivorans]